MLLHTDGYRDQGHNFKPATTDYAPAKPYFTAVSVLTDRIAVDQQDHDSRQTQLRKQAYPNIL
jgi:hypothetical protein